MLKGGVLIGGDRCRADSSGLLPVYCELRDTRLRDDCALEVTRGRLSFVLPALTDRRGLVWVFSLGTDGIQHRDAEGAQLAQVSAESL